MRLEIDLMEGRGEGGGAADWWRCGELRPASECTELEQACDGGGQSRGDQNKGGCQRETGAGRAPKVAAAGKRAAAVSIPVGEEEQGAGVAGIACWEQTVFRWG